MGSPNATASHFANRLERIPTNSSTLPQEYFHELQRLLLHVHGKREFTLLRK